MKLTSVEEVLRFAIRKEADATAFYRLAAERSNPGVNKTFQELANEEEEHKKKLEELDLEEVEQIDIKGSEDLSWIDLMEDVPFAPEMSYADLLRMAMKNEERSRRLYLGAARLVNEGKVKRLLNVLAEEERGHKERLEKIYDRDVLTEF